MVVVMGIILILFTKNFLIVIVIDIRARSWLDFNDLFIFTAFQHQSLLLVHLQRLEWIEFKVIFETLILYQLVKHIFYVVIWNCLSFGHVNQYQINHFCVFGYQSKMKRSSELNSMLIVFVVSKIITQ
jgi:hypothetical protein